MANPRALGSQIWLAITTAVIVTCNWMLLGSDMANPDWSTLSTNPCNGILTRYWQLTLTGPDCQFSPLQITVTFFIAIYMAINTKLYFTSIERTLLHQDLAYGQSRPYTHTHGQDCWWSVSVIHIGLRYTTAIVLACWRLG